MFQKFGVAMAGVVALLMVLTTGRWMMGGTVDVVRDRSEMVHAMPEEACPVDFAWDDVFGEPIVSDGAAIEACPYMAAARLQTR